MSVRVDGFRGSSAEWDRFVRAQPGWTHFHLFGWGDVIADVHAHDVIRLCARSGDGRLQGVLPLIRVASPVFGRYLVSMPYVNYGGPLGAPDAVQALVAVAEAKARDDNGTLLELRSRHELPVSLRASHRKITCVLDLPVHDADAVWRGLDANVRRRVRRAQKAGVTLAFGADQIAPFYEVFAHHMRDLGTPAQPRRWFEAIARMFPDDAEFGCAYLGTRPIAVIAGLKWGDEFEVTWASALVEHKELAANMLIYWAFIERCAGAGLKHFNFGRCSPGSGTHRFKRQWGANDETLWWYAGDHGAHAATPAPSDPGFAWGPRIWKHLPARLATAMGPHIVRYIP